MTDMHTTCRRAVTRDDLSACFAIREAVFIGEQNVDAALERDGLDDDCIHYLAEAGGRAVGTARVRVLDDCYKFQRVAVLKAARGRNVGAALMRFMMADLAATDDSSGRHFFLSSQVHAVPFYERLGFAVCSDEYQEAGIPHRDMRAEMAKG